MALEYKNMTLPLFKWKKTKVKNIRAIKEIKIDKFQTNKSKVIPIHKPISRIFDLE